MQDVADDWEDVPATSNVPQKAKPAGVAPADDWEDVAAPRAGILQTAGLVGRQLMDAATHHAPAAIAAALEGDDPYAERDWKDTLIERSRAKAKERTAEYGKGPTSIPWVGDREDIAQLGPSFGASVPASVAGLAAGVGTGAVTALTPAAPAAPYAGLVAGTAAAGALAYRGSTNQFVRDLRENVDAERAKSGKEPISDEEFNAKRKELAPLIKEYGLWEAIPEAAGQALGLKIVTAPVKGAIGKVFGDNVVKRFITKGAALYGEELATETITQQGQHNVEHEAGMKPGEQPRSWTSPHDLAESFKEVAPVTTLQTTLMGAGIKAGQMAHRLATRDSAADNAPPPQDQAEADQLRSILGEPAQTPPGAPPAAPNEDQRSILGEDRPDESRPDSEYYVAEAMRNLRATSRTANGVLDTSSTPGKEDQMTGVSAKHAATLAQENFEGVIRGIYDRLDDIPQDGQRMAGFIDDTAEAVNAGIVKPEAIIRTNDTKIPAQTAAKDLPAAHAQFSEEMAERLADPNADPVETAAWIEWRSNMIDHFWTDGVGKTSKALAAIPLMRAGLPLPNYPSSREFFSYSPKERVDPNGGGEAYLGPAWDRFNAYYHTLVGKPEAQQRADLKAMVADQNVSVEDLAKQPLVQRAIEENRRAVQTGSADDFRNPEWRDRRVYDFGGESVHGWDEAVTRLTASAEAFSTAEPVENGRRAVIVLGPPAAGKSTVSEPLARALHAALVDADEAKKVIPEYHNGLGSNAVHEESSHLAAYVLSSLVSRGANLILPKVGHNYESIKGLVDRLKKRGYSVDIAHVSATPEISGRRNIKRFLETGRLVDPEYITEVGDKPRDTAYMLKGEANDFIDARTTNGFEIVEGSGPLADALRARRDTGHGHERGPGSPGSPGEGSGQELVGDLVDGLRPHRVTDSDGRSVEVAPVIVEASSLRTSRDYGYDQDLQPRDRDRAASDAQIREITNKLDPERLGYSSEADRGSPIIGSDRMVESGNGRVIALRNVYDKNGPQAEAYRNWLRNQGVNVDAYQHPVLVRQRLTPLTPKERQAFTLAANRPATLAMSAPERAVSDARHIDARMLGLIKNPDDIGSIANRAFFRRFLSMLPKSEHGVLADAKGHLSAEGLTRARNAILARAYGDTGILARIAESTNDEVKSISNALLAAAPAWAKLRADVEAGHVRADIDTTADLVRAVDLTAEIRGRGEKLDAFLDQHDAFDRLPGEVENFMRIFYDPTGRRAASAQRIADTIRFIADEGSKVSAEKGLGLDLIPVSAQDIQRVAIEREWEDVEQQAPKPGDGVGDGSRGPQGGGEVRGPWLGAGREVAAQRLDAGDPVEEAIRAQQPTLDDLRAVNKPVANAETWWAKELTGYGRNQVTNAASVPQRWAKATWQHIPPDIQKKLATVIGTALDPARAGATEKTKAGDQFVFPGGERISTAELARRRAAEPMRPRLEQKPADFGLFGEIAPQGDLLQNREQTPTIKGTTESGDGHQGPGIQPAAQGVPGKTQARRLAKPAIKRPPELPLFGWGASERPVSEPDAGVRAEPGSEGPAVHGEGPSVTKPPARSGRTRAGRTDSPAVKGRLEAEKKIAERSRSNYRITDEDQIGVGNARQKIRGNLDAIRTLKLIQDEARFATPAEKAVLVKYVGWGAFAQDMFATHKPEWKNERDAFRALVSDEEYNAAKASTLNAHFTSPDVIRGMWDAMQHLGFKGGQAIEPAAGVGHFIGLTPDKVAAKTAWTAVELDPLTGGIAKALYGGSDIGIHGFEDLKRPSNYYDLAISNVPFGDYQISEKPYGSFPIHDFFFVKSLDKVRPGGIVAFITSRYTMDRVAPETRRLLGQNADLVGAIRLPGGRKGAFAGNAGTEVTTDIIFLRKKVPGEPAFPGAAWTELKEIKTKDGPVKINEYFADRPEMMLGEMRLQGTMYRSDEPILVGTAEGIQERIAEAARKMPEGALLPMKSPPPPPISGDEIGAGIKDGSFFVQNGKVYQRQQGQGFEHKLNPAEADRVTRFVEMRGIINDLLQTQLNRGDNATEQAEHLRGRLRAAYDAFVERHGPINKEVRTVTNRLNKDGEPVVITKRPNFDEFRGDPDATKVAAIEQYDPETGKTKRSAIQVKDVIDAPKERQINGPSDALSASLNDTAGVDLDHIAQSLNLDSHDAVIQALGDQVYQNPNGRQWETADQYLSGDVVKKLEDARALAEQDPSYLRNVSALEKVQPQPLTGTDITAQFGAPWIPGEVYQDFLKEIGIIRPRVARVPITGEWHFDYQSATRDAQTKYGTDRVEVGKIVNAALNNKMVTVYDRGAEKDTVNDKATQEARVKTELLKEAFTGDMMHGIDGWVFGEPERAQLLEGIYNRTYNNLAPRKFDGSHLTLPGMNPDFTTRKHRLDAIWRIIQSGNTLLAHVVGSGKTATMIGAGMEEKRLGLINKPAYVIPNHMLEQFSREFIETYPNAKILVAQKDEMTRENRREFLAKVAANDWDGVIITHDAFGRINMGHEFRAKFIQDQLDELERVMQAEVAASNDKKSPTVKNLEKAKKKLEERLRNLMNEERKDAGTSFEESGIDRLYVDEAHKFKNLQFITRLQNISGLAQGNSQRAEDLFLKIRYLEEKRPGRSAVFATGTPISNTMAELWTMMRYLELDKLRERGLDTFDSWASTFGRVVSNMELSPDGRTFKEKSSFSKFVNIPELIALYSEVSDTKTADMLNLPRPEVRTRSGAPGIEIVEATPSAEEEAHIESLVKLAESLKGKRPEKGEPNMLSVVTAGRKVATDGRLISGDFEFNPQGKIAKAVDNISRIYQEGNKDPAAPDKVQMVFLDMGVPQSRSAKKPKAVEGEISVGPTPQDRINLYADLKERLVAKGIPAKEIAAIHDATDDNKKANLFKRVRSGEIRVIMGSSEKMGVGTNVQDLLIAMHHLDAPWKPAEVEQRDGRIVRQGNKNKTVQIYRYVTKKSFDAFMWQKLDTKSKFIGQVLSGAKGSRHAEDIDNPLPEAAEMKAAASGDPRILELAELDRVVRALTAQRRAHESTKARANSEINAGKSRVASYEEALPNAKEDAAAVQDITGDKFAVELGGVGAGTVTNRAEAGKAILDRLSELDPNLYRTPKVFNLGRLSGFTMNLELRGAWDGTGVILRATPSLKGKSGYSSPNDTVINEHTDPAGLIRRYENILANIKSNPERLTRELANEKESLGKLQRTMAGEWPKEKEYREALKKLDDLSTSMRAPEHPDVVEVKAQQPRPTDTPEFRKWFGKSKVVDAKGKPLVVYHGSNRRFTEFKPRAGMRRDEGGPPYEVKSPAFFFTPDKATAHVYAKDRVLIDQRLRGKSGGRPNTKAVYLSVKQPLDFSLDYDTAARLRDDELYYVRPGEPNPLATEEIERITAYQPQSWREVQEALDDPHVVEELKALGFDGARLSEEDGSDAWAVFEPTQIKSATGNSGAFDPKAADIRANKPDERKEYLTVDGKLAWAVVVDPIDNAILHSVRYKHAADNDFHHSFYMPERFARMVSDGHAILAWADAQGIHAMEPLPAKMREAIAKHYDPIVKSRTGWESVEGDTMGPQPGEREVRIGRTFVAHVSDTYSAAEQKIADAVSEIGARMAPQVDVVGTKALRLQGSPIWGAFVNNPTFPHLVAWSLEQGNASKIAGTVRHEIVHHLRAAGLIRPAEWKALEEAAVKNDWLGKHDIEARYQGLSQDHKIEEAVAEQFGEWRKERSIEKPGLIRDAFNRIDLLLRRVAAAARKFLGAKATANDVFTRIETGEIGRREKPRDTANDDLDRAWNELHKEAAQRKSGLSQSVVDGLERHAKALTDLLESQAFGAKGFSDRSIKASVVRHMLGVTRDKEVLRRIVGALPVEVMDFFARKKLAPERALSDKSVLEDMLSVDRQSAVALGIDEAVSTALVRAVAGNAAKLSGLAGGTLESGPASANTNDAVLPAHGRRITDNPAFSRWFGDSKVVDEEGKPLVAYHGTVHDFAVFDTRRESKKERPSRAWSGDLGSWFAAPSKHQSNYDEGNAEYQAGSYAEDRNTLDFADGANIKPSYLSIKNPMEYQDWDEFYDDRHEDGERLSAEKFRSKLEAKGYDGIVIRNSETDGNVDRDDWIAFHPTQIKSATGNRGTFDPNDPDVRAQTPGREARERRQAAAVPANTIWQRVVQSSDNLRAKTDAFADRMGVNEIIRSIQMSVAPMAARDATVVSRLIAKEWANADRQARHDWNNADKLIKKNFSHERRKAMWEAADEQSVAMQQGLPTAGIGLDRLPPNERAVVEMLQARGIRNFDEAKRLRMVQTDGLPSYAPRMLVRMSSGEAEYGAGAGSEIVRDIRTLALANARLERAIAGRKLINSIEDVGRRTGSMTVNTGGPPSAHTLGAGAEVAQALDQMGQGFSKTTPQLKHRKHLTAAETEAAAQLVRTPDPDAPKWFTLNNPAFFKLEPRLRLNETTGKVQVVKDADGNPILDSKPIYIRSDFEGPLRAILGKGWDHSKLYQAAMALKGKAMSVIMMSPLIHNQVEWGRALPAAPGKVLTFQVYVEGNAVAHDPDRMRQAIAGGTAPIGGHGFMQDLTAIAEEPTVRPGRSLTAKGAGYAAQATGAITRIYDPRAGADEVRKAVDYMGDVWHNTLLWDRIRDLQMGLWSHINEGLVAKGYDPYAANVAASHFANRYAGSLPIEAMSGIARGIANLLLFSRSFTLGNLGAFKDAFIGLPRDAQAMIEHHVGYDELQKIQSFVKRKSRAMLAIDAGMYYATLSALQSAFNVAGVVPSVATLGGMILGGALGGKGGKYGRIALAVGGGATAFGLAAVLGASPGTKKLEEELEGYWNRFAELLHRIGEHPFGVVGHPIETLESLSATAENEPGKKGRILVGFQPDGTAIYARLAVGKVTEEFIGWGTSPLEMIHNKLSTFARPLYQIITNDVGFGHKLYNPKADTYGEQAKNIMKIGAAIVGSQIPLDTIKGAKEWMEGGPGSDVAGLKAIAPFIGTTISKGYPGGPELGVLNDARERQKFQLNEWMPEIRKQIKNGEIDKAITKMQELGVPPGLQKYYIQTTQNPSARLTKRQMQDFMRYATPEQQKEFEAAHDRSQNRATGGGVKEESYGDWRERIGWADGGRVLARANGGRVESPSTKRDLGVRETSFDGVDADTKFFGNLARAQAIRVHGFDALDGKVQHVVLSHVRAALNDHKILKVVIQSIPVDVVDMLVGRQFSAEKLLHDPAVLTHRLSLSGDVTVRKNVVRFIDTLAAVLKLAFAGRLAKETPLPASSVMSRSEGNPTISADSFGRLIHRDTIHGQVIETSINPSKGQKQAGNYLKGSVRIHGLDISIENPKGTWRSGVGKDGKPWECQLSAHYGYVKRTHGQDDDHIDVYLGPHLKSPHVFVVDQVDAETKKPDEAKAMLGFGSQKQALACYERAFSDGKGRARIGAVTTMTVPQFKEWLATETEKRTHASVDYVEQATGKDHCAICKHFIAGNPPACTGVKSPISPLGWCKRFARG